MLNGGGTLVLSGANIYTGGTTICGTACGGAGGGSVLVVGTDTAGTPGAIVSSAIGTGRLTFDGGTLQAGGNYTHRERRSDQCQRRHDRFQRTPLHLFSNIADGAGGRGSLLIKDSDRNEAPLVTLSGSNTYSGGTSVIGTTVRATNSSSFGSGAR